MTDFSEFRSLAEELKRRADERDEVTPEDPAAKVMRFCAEQIENRIAKGADTDVWWTTDKVAAACRCSVAAVQYWCRNANKFEIRVEKTPSGKYRLHRDDVLARAKAA